ncbi:hypothetical protein FBU59_005232, partial [Linderina macrospora]
MFALRSAAKRALLLRSAPLATKATRSHRGLATFSLPKHAPSPRPFRYRGLQTSAVLSKTISYNLADIGEGITECEIIQWFVKPGDKVAQFDKICEVASDKATVEITSRYDGEIAKLHYNDNEIALVGKPLVDIKMDGEESAETKTEEPATAAATEEKPSQAISAQSADQSTQAASAELHDYSAARTNDVVYATPAVRRFAREHNVDLKFVPGTGKEGRILKDDVVRFINNGPPEAPTTVQTPAASIPGAIQTSPSVTSSHAPLSSASAVVTGTDREQALTPIQRAMFKSMTDSLGIPHFRFKDEIELDALMQARARINSYLGNDADAPITKLSYMPFFIKATSLALAKYPVLNAKVINDGTPKLLYRAAHNIGVAMDTPGGLIVPNIKNVQTKSLIEIAAELQHLVNKGKSGAISGADLKGGTFTLSNVGMIGGTYLSPVVVSSEVCIGAIGKTQRLPRYESVIEDGRVVEKV